jgi:hypothetical protein
MYDTITKSEGDFRIQPRRGPAALKLHESPEVGSESQNIKKKQE